MARAAFILLLLASLVAIPASATHIDTVQPRAHASITKSTVHRSRSSSRPTASRTTSHSSGKNATRKSSASRATSRRGSSRAGSSTRRVTSSSTGKATLRRSRYNRNHSSGRFVTAAAAPVASTRSGTINVPDESADSTEPARAETRAEIATSPRSNPRPADATPAANAMPPETDTAPAPGTDPATIAAAGNPLAAPRETRQAIAPGAGQVAELNRPPIITGRVSRYTLRGTHDSLVRQNARAEEDSLERIEDDADLQDRIARGLLVHVPESNALIVNSALPDDRRYCRQWTANFLIDLSRAHQLQFHSPLIVSSAVRTVEFQKHLMRINGNAADAEGEIVSPHLTGATIDIAKSGLSRKEMVWMRNQLLTYQNAGVIDVEEEFHQRCFHITVYKNYPSTAQSHMPRKAVPTPPTAEAGTTTESDAAPDSQ